MTSIHKVSHAEFNESPEQTSWEEIIWIYFVVFLLIILVISF